MGTSLHDLKPNPGATKNRKRIGRGHGSGTHKTAGKGMKGQKARTGHHGARFGFEGGQMPMQRRLPKRGFKNAFGTEYSVVNLRDISKRFAKGGSVDPTSLTEAGLVRSAGVLIKVLGTGEISAKVQVKAHAFSESAKRKIEQAGGSIELISTAPVPAGSVPAGKGA